MKKIKLGDVGNILNGESIPSEDGIYPAYGGNGIIKQVSSYNYNGNVIAIGRVGAQCGVVHYCAEKCWITDNCLCFQPNENFNPYYVYYLLKLLNLNKFHIGSAQPLITQTIIKNITCDLPPKETQDKIAALLGALDDKIALNKKINATLEAMAKTLYDYWFVQFDFPDENGKPYKTSGGKMIYSSKLGRDISAGWEVGTLENFGTLKNGINYDKNTIGDCRVKIVNVKDISNSTFSIATESLDDINLPEEQTRKYLTTTKDILIARSGIPGAVRTLADENFHSIYCGFIICFQPQNKLWKNFMTFTLQKHYEIISTQSAGTIMQNITQDTLKNFRLIVPPLSVLEKFNRVVEPMIFKINKNILESRRLAALRDWLLPMLMNGQIKF